MRKNVQVTDPPSHIFVNFLCHFYNVLHEREQSRLFISLIEPLTLVSRKTSSRTCYSMDPLPVEGHHTPMATECPTPTTSTASTPSTTVGQQTVAPGGTYKTHVQTVHGNTDSSSDSSFAVITGTIVGVLALTVSILLFG